MPPAFLLLHPPCSSLATLLTPASGRLLSPSLLPCRSRLWVSCTGWITAAADIWTQCLCVGPPRVPSTSSSQVFFFFDHSDSETLADIKTNGGIWCKKKKDKEPVSIHRQEVCASMFISGDIHPNQRTTVFKTQAIWKLPKIRVKAQTLYKVLHDLSSYNPSSAKVTDESATFALLLTLFQPL